MLLGLRNIPGGQYHPVEKTHTQQSVCFCAPCHYQSMMKCRLGSRGCPGCPLGKSLFSRQSRCSTASHNLLLGVVTSGHEVAHWLCRWPPLKSGKGQWFVCGSRNAAGSPAQESSVRTSTGLVAQRTAVVLAVLVPQGPLTPLPIVPWSGSVPRMKPWAQEGRGVGLGSLKYDFLLRDPVAPCSLRGQKEKG